jgi:hypothetical protein
MGFGKRKVLNRRGRGERPAEPAEKIGKEQTETLPFAFYDIARLY